MFLKKFAVAAGAATMLAGCVSVPADNGRADVGKLLEERGLPAAETADPEAWTAQQLREPVTADAAVKLALANSPELRRSFAQLGLSAAELHDAGRLANPVLSVARMSPGDPAAENAKLSLGIAIDFTDLLLWPARKRFSSAQFEAAKLSAGASALDHAAATASAWYEAVVAERRANLRDMMAGSAEAAAAMARRFHDAGNINRRELASETAAAGSARAEALAARAEAAAARQRLAVLMGLPASRDDWQLALDLPLPVDDIAGLDELLATAGRQRLDIAAAERRSAALARRHGVERRTRFIDGIEIGYEREKDFDGTVNKGPSLAVGLPLFNGGGGRVRAARAAMELEDAGLDALALTAGGEVRSAHAALEAARQRVDLYRTVIVPQRAEITEQLRRELDYMLTGVFEAMSEKQQELRTREEYLAALGDYWRARVALAHAVGGRLPAVAARTGSGDAHDDGQQDTEAEQDSSGHNHGVQP